MMVTMVAPLPCGCRRRLALQLGKGLLGCLQIPRRECVTKSLQWIVRRRTAT